ncbi:MAG: hypothetical protein LBD72_00335 [Puniceicoccales bacterium]|jgi:hypothetical protein|nr:hypothetical protein [Puniceicoccales bacterium]
MKSAPVISYVSKRVHKCLHDRAADLGVSLSRYVCRVLEDDCERNNEDCPYFPKAELEDRLRSADNPKNCIEYGSAEDLIKHMREVDREIKNRKALR